jgi:predicted lipid carrier protein YhbT
VYDGPLAVSDADDPGRDDMSKWLTQEWLDETRKMAEGQPERPGASARMQYVVTGGPEGDIDYYWVLENGKITESQLGSLADSEVTLTTAYGDALKIQKGELDANAAFMQGKVKVTGNMAKVMALLPITNAPEYKALQAEIAAITEF